MRKIKSGFEVLENRGSAALASALFNLTRASLQRTLFNCRYLCKKVNNYKMYLDLQDPGISRSLILFGTRELDHKIILEKVLAPGMRVFDIGANIGYYVLMEKSLIRDEGEIIAIEPSPSNIDLLKKNLKLNNQSKVTVLPGAVSSSSGNKKFFLAEHSNLNTFHPEGSAGQFMSGKTITVQTYTVSELADKYGAPDLIRMDVEGHEVDVIYGMLDDIKNNKYKPMICFETHLSCYSKKNDMAALLKQLFENGYKTRYLSSSYERGTKLINERGYKGFGPIKTDSKERFLYENLKPEDAIDFISGVGGARTVLLAP